MGKRLTLVLGGARSGKSALAQKLAAETGSAVLFVATAVAGDEEMARRIAAHQAARPPHWRTLEAPRRAGAAIEEAEAGAEVVVVDCLTLLASNALLAPWSPADSAEAPGAASAAGPAAGPGLGGPRVAGPRVAGGQAGHAGPLPRAGGAAAAGPAAAPETGGRAVEEEVEALLRTYRSSRAAWIVVSNEVGLGIVPPHPLGRAFRDALGRANQRLAEAADSVLFLVAGLPLRLK